KGKIARYIFETSASCGLTENKEIANRRTESIRTLEWTPDLALTSEEKLKCDYHLGNCVELVP
ncbi:19361_t:CDS:1, partial [Rhizophagus irregularis]